MLCTSVHQANNLRKSERVHSLLGVCAGNGAISLDSSTSNARAVVVPARSVEALKPDAPCSIDRPRARLNTRSVELELIVGTESPTFGL